MPVNSGHFCLYRNAKIPALATGADTGLVANACARMSV